MGQQWIISGALVIVVVGSVLFTLALPTLGLAALRGSTRAVGRITAVMIALAVLVLVAALILGFSSEAYMRG